MSIKYLNLLFIFLMLVLFTQYRILSFNNYIKLNQNNGIIENENNKINLTTSKIYKIKINPQYINKKNENNKSNRNVVVGLLAIYNYTIVEPFFKSLRKTGYEGEIVCFTLDKSLNIYEKIFEKYNIKPIIFSKTHPYYLSNSKHYPISKEKLKNMSAIPHEVFFFANVRFFLLYFWLEEYSSKFDYVLTCDLRDSLFQRNPFEWNYQKGVYLTHETQHCKYYESKRCSLANRNWFFNLNPPKHLLNNTFINAGQIFGSSIEMRDFLKEYTEMMYNIHLKNKRRVDTCDQGILNLYVYTKNEFNFPLYLFEAEHGYARVLGLDLGRSRTDYQPNENMTIVNKDNTVPTILHQYLPGLTYGSVERKRKFLNLFIRYIN